jgi:hypothetical protein
MEEQRPNYILFIAQADLISLITNTGRLITSVKHSYEEGKSNGGTSENLK